MPLAVALVAAGSLVDVVDPKLAGPGIAYAAPSGALTSGLGYVVWYAALPSLRTTGAATIQLSVPLLATAGGLAVVGEAVTPRLVVAAVAILGGIALVLRAR